MLVAPSEPPALRALRTSDRSPERWGCDVFFVARGQRCGIQRKELGDFISSAQDGRLAKEIAQMATGLDRAMVVVEGEPRWGLDGELLDQHSRAPRWSKAAHVGLLWSVRDRGVAIDWTRDLPGTIELIGLWKAWCEKTEHRSLDHRPGPTSPWGRPSNKDYARHLLMGIPGVGVEIADRIINHFGGVPWTWIVTEQELQQVKGVGKKLASKMIQALPLSANP